MCITGNKKQSLILICMTSGRSLLCSNFLAKIQNRRMMQRSSPLGKNTVHEAKERFLYFEDGRFSATYKITNNSKEASKH